MDTACSHTPAHACTYTAKKEKPLSVPPYLCLRETSGGLQQKAQLNAEGFTYIYR